MSAGVFMMAVTTIDVFAETELLPTGLVPIATNCDAHPRAMETRQVMRHLGPISWAINSAIPEQQVTAAADLNMLTATLEMDGEVGVRS